MHIGYVPHERPPFSALNFRSGAIIFPNYQKISSGASPFYIFCRSGDHHFQNFFNFNPFIASHGRLSPNALAAPRVSSRLRVPARCVLVVPETSIFTLKTDQARSGAPHFQVQNGSSSFRSPLIFTLDRELVPEPLPIFHFPAAHTYQNKFGGVNTQNGVEGLILQSMKTTCDA